MTRLPLALLLLAASPAWGDVTVTTEGERVSLRAVAAPLHTVLDQLARKTGMKVVYEGGQPRQPVTLTFEGRTVTEAVLAVLEGQGVNFGLRADESGSRVVNLIVAGTATAATATKASAPAAPPRPGAVSRPPVPEPEEEKDYGEEPPEEEVVPPGAPPPNAPPAQPPMPVVPQGPTYFNSPFAPKAPPPLTVAPGQPPTTPKGEEEPQ